MHTLIYSGKCKRCLVALSFIKCLSSPILFLSLLRRSCLLMSGLWRSFLFLSHLSLEIML